MNKTSRLLAVWILACGLAASCSTTTAPDLGNMSFSESPLLGKMVWHDLVTEDIDAAQRFYGGLFGWSFEPATGPTGGRYMVARLNDTYVAGMVAIEPPADGKKLSRWLPYVSVEDVDVAVKASVSGGGAVVAEARDVPMGRVAAVIDTDGAVIGLARSRLGDPDDDTTAAAPGNVVWNELLSNDTARAIGFYQKVVGYQARTVQRRGGDYVMLAEDGVDRAGVLQNPVAEWQPAWLTHFGVRDPAAAAARAEELGGTILIPVSPEVRDGTMAVVADTTGAILILQQWTM